MEGEQFSRIYRIQKGYRKAGKRDKPAWFLYGQGRGEATPGRKK